MKTIFACDFLQEVVGEERPVKTTFVVSTKALRKNLLTLNAKKLSIMDDERTFSVKMNKSFV